MDRWELLDSEPVPGGQGVMRLMRRGDELVIRVDERELMSTKLHGSEDALAELALTRLGVERSQTASVLVGGLGIGFTLAAALGRLGPEGRAVVAELVPAVVRWNQGPLGEAAGHPLSDERVTVHPGDVSDLVRHPPAPWDAILLDVDNGPTALTRPSNSWLYGWEGLGACLAALVPGGVLAVWSAAPDRAFTHRLEKAGFATELVMVRARGARGGRRHQVWLARK